MSLKLINVPSESSSMNCTYPPTTKPSKQSTYGNCKPITRNALTRSPLFFLRSSSHFLRLGHRCRHYESLHSWVSYVWLLMLYDLLMCGYIIFHEASSIYGFLYSMFVCGFCVQHLCVVFFVFSMTLVCGFLSPSCNFVYFSSYLCCIWIYVSLLCIFHVGVPNRGCLPRGFLTWALRCRQTDVGLPCGFLWWAWDSLKAQALARVLWGVNRRREKIIIKNKK